MEQPEDKENSAGEMKKRRVMMADGKRYLIYYTFENSELPDNKKLKKTEGPENV